MCLESSAVNRSWLSLIAHGPVSKPGRFVDHDIYGWRNDSVRLVTRRSLCPWNERPSVTTLVRGLIVAVARNEGRKKCVRTHVAWAAFRLLRPIQKSFRFIASTPRYQTTAQHVYRVHQAQCCLNPCEIQNCSSLPLFSPPLVCNSQRNSTLSISTQSRGQCLHFNPVSRQASGVKTVSSRCAAAGIILSTTKVGALASV
ncbi:unnamed protein product, partial [Ectocarpus sp. 12 AP-2014]